MNNRFCSFLNQLLPEIDHGYCHLDTRLVLSEHSFIKPRMMTVFKSVESMPNRGFFLQRADPDCPSLSAPCLYIGQVQCRGTWHITERSSLTRPFGKHSQAFRGCSQEVSGKDCGLPREKLYPKQVCLEIKGMNTTRSGGRSRVPHCVLAA